MSLQASSEDAGIDGAVRTVSGKHCNNIVLKVQNIQVGNLFVIVYRLNWQLACQLLSANQSKQYGVTFIYPGSRGLRSNAHGLLVQT